VIARFTARPVARVAAALLAVVLSGVPRLASPNSGEKHVCQCAARGKSHDCSCPICRANERQRPSVGSKDDASVPPCHRAKAATSSDAGLRHGGSIPSDEGPIERDCVSESCGRTRPGVAVVNGLEPFTLPSSVDLTPRSGAEPVVFVHAAALELPILPELPPPRG